MANNIDDKWLIVYQGTWNNYDKDSNKDSYKNKLVLVTGNKDSDAEIDQTPYLCVDNDTQSVKIPIPVIYLRGVSIGKTTYGFTDSILAFAKANGIDISYKSGAVTIGIDDATLAKINSIDNKVGKTDTIPAENVGGLSNGTKGLVSTNPIIANRIPYLNADAFAFLQPEDFTVEVAYDGITWETLDNNNADMRGMFAQLNFGTGFPIDGNNTNWQVGSKVRITLSPKNARNTKIDFVTLNVCTNGRTFDILTEYYDSSSGKEGWYSVGDQLNISSNGIAFVKYNQYFSYAGYARGGARFTFTITRNTQYGSRIVGISGFGNLASELTPTSGTAPYTLGTLWYWDYLKNVYFPNDIYEGGTPLKNKYASISEIPTALPNPESLKYTVNGMSYTYDGSSETTIPQIFTPTQIGSQGQLLQSMGGGAPQWTNLSSIKEAIGFAKDLTGVLEATPEEFTFRPSAGDKSIRDESAVIRRIKGNTSVWGQYVKNPIFADGTANWGSNGATLSVNSNGGVNFVTTSSSSQSINQVLTDAIPKGHKVLIVIDYKRNTTTPLDVLFYLRKSSGGFDQARIYNVADSNRRVESVIITTTDAIMSTTSSSLLVYPMMNGASGLTAIIYSINVFDLTAIFGAGNEPSTLEEFKRSYPDSYYPYCEPEIRNMRALGIETISANAFDKDSTVAGVVNADGTIVDNANYSLAKIEVVPNEKYSLQNVANTAYDRISCSCVLYDSNDKVVSTIGIRDTTTTNKAASGDVNIPINARYMSVVVHNDYLDSCCVNLRHSGTFNIGDAVYFKKIRDLSEIANYFPDGMNGVGEVYDEINAENAVKRFGVVDLGTLNWSIVGTANNVDKRIYSYGLNNIAKGAATHVVSNIMCAKYNAISADQNYLRNKGISLSQTSTGVMLHIYDPDYNSDDNLSDFKASLNGVLLCYELTEPIVTPITEPLQLDYEVADFGTEKALTAPKSSPFKADIVYQFNAEGRIRDNSRNIERIEAQTRGFATRDFVYKIMPTEIATATQLHQFASLDEIEAILPNIMYEYTSGLGQNATFVLPEINTITGEYDHTWMLRLPSIANSNILQYPYTIKWKDGTPPTFVTACTLEIYLKKDGAGAILGEWKIYR